MPNNDKSLLDVWPVENKFCHRSRAYQTFCGKPHSCWLKTLMVTSISPWPFTHKVQSYATRTDHKPFRIGVKDVNQSNMLIMCLMVLEFASQVLASNFAWKITRKQIKHGFLQMGINNNFVQKMHTPLHFTKILLLFWEHWHHFSTIFFFFFHWVWTFSWLMAKFTTFETFCTLLQFFDVFIITSMLFWLKIGFHSDS